MAITFTGHLEMALAVWLWLRLPWSRIRDFLASLADAHYDYLMINVSMIIFSRI
jgi:hypothetical protein